MLLQQKNTQDIIVSQAENSATQNRPSLKDVACKTTIGLGYNLIPANVHKKSLVKWRAYQEKKGSLPQYQQWLTNPWQASPINWLILMGRKPYSDAPGLVALDADDQQAMKVVEVRCPPTPLWTDTSRGRQYLYRRPDGPARVKSRNKTTIDGMTEDLDIKADGGYVVAPGSQHARAWLAGLEKSYNLGGKALITEWYDKDDDFRRETKSSGTYYIYKPRLPILAASTVQWLTQNCQESDLMGGFLPRWLFFHETKKDYILSVRDDPVEELRPELEDHLRRIKGHHGEVKLSSGAFDYYWDWRREIEESAEPAVKGWVNRLGDNAFKVAVIYEASVADHLAEISETNMKLACNLMSTIKTDLVDLLANELAWTDEGKELQKVVWWLRQAGKAGILHGHLLRGLSPMRAMTLKEQWSSPRFVTGRDVPVLAPVTFHQGFLTALTRSNRPGSLVLSKLSPASATNRATFSVVSVNRATFLPIIPTPLTLPSLIARSFASSSTSHTVSLSPCTSYFRKV